MSAGGSVGSSDSRFERKGTAETVSYRELGANHQDRFGEVFQAVRPRTADASVNPFLNQTINKDAYDHPYANAVCRLLGANMGDQSSPAESSMLAQATQNIYGGDYARNTFDRYQADVGNAMAGARSGPAMTRGGTAAQGFAQAQAAGDVSMNREQQLVQNRQADAQISQGAAGMMSQNRDRMNDTAISAIGAGQQGFGQLLSPKMAAAGLASERTKMFADLVPTFATLETPMRTRESNDLRGRGSQSSQSMGAGLNVCCFIFMEAYNGDMPWYVRACRDEFAPENTARRNGYIRMSKWLVPAMRTSKVVRGLTNALLIKPLTRWGAWYKGESEGAEPKLCALAKSIWFTVWTVTGKEN